MLAEVIIKSIFNNMDETKFSKYLYNQITFILAIVSIAWGIFVYLSSPTTEILLMKKDLEGINKGLNNELLHLSDNYKTLSSNYTEQNKQINEMNLKIEKVLTILGK